MAPYPTPGHRGNSCLVSELAGASILSFSAWTCELSCILPLRSDKQGQDPVSQSFRSRSALLRKMPGQEPGGGAARMQPAPSWCTCQAMGHQQAWPWAGCPTNGWEGGEAFSCLSLCISSSLSSRPSPGPPQASAQSTLVPFCSPSRKHPQVSA